MIFNKVNLNEAIKYNPSMIKSVRYDEKNSLMNLLRKYITIS